MIAAAIIIPMVVVINDVCIPKLCGAEAAFRASFWGFHEETEGCGSLKLELA